MSEESSSVEGEDGGVGGGEGGGESGENLTNNLLTRMLTVYLRTLRMGCNGISSWNGSGTHRVLASGMNSGLVVHAVSLNTERFR